MRRNRRFLTICGIFLVVAVFALNVFLNSIYRLPILMYHSFNNTSTKDYKVVVSPEVFEAQIAYLCKAGYDVISLDKAVWYMEQEKRPPRKTVAITIDDGYTNNYTAAYPILKKYNIPVTIFVIVDLIGKEGYMDWGQLKEMSDSGLVDIESHTMSHPWLQYVDDDRLKHELVDSKKTLEEKLGKDIKFVCYPMGGYDERVKSAAKEAGYEAAFATKPRKLFPSYDTYEIKRVRISPTANNIFVFKIKISGYHAFLKTL